MHDLLVNRPQSGFPVSIGTGLSLESLFTPIQAVVDENRIVNNIPDLSVYNLYVFNISTLLRNIINSVKFSELISMPKKDIYDCLLEEIDFLTNFFSSNLLQIKFYVNTYTYVKDVYGKTDRLRKMTTDKQMYIDNLMTYCLDKIRKEDDVEIFHKDIKYGKENSVLLFTHVPFDLLSHSNFFKLDLLESHTGTIKSRKEFNTKYYSLPGDKDMSFIPFHEHLLCDVFGDSIMFHPASVKDRLATYEMLKKKGVNSLTSDFSLGVLLK